MRQTGSAFFIGPYTVWQQTERLTPCCSCGYACRGDIFLRSVCFLRGQCNKDVRVSEPLYFADWPARYEHRDYIWLPRAAFCVLCGHGCVALNFLSQGDFIWQFYLAVRQKTPSVSKSISSLWCLVPSPKIKQGEPSLTLCCPGRVKYVKYVLEECKLQTVILLISYKR